MAHTRLAIRSSRRRLARTRPSRLGAALLGIAALLAGLAADRSAPSAAVRAAAAGSCDKFAAPHGSDSARGSKRRPFRSAPRLAAALRPGKTGCFRGGTYRFSDLRLEARRSTLRAFQNERVTLRGDIRIAPSATGAAIAGMRLNGTNDESEIQLTLFANHSVLHGNAITNRHSSASCVYVARYHSGPPPRGVRILGNRIHDCGGLPVTNHHHGVYVAAARRTKIKNNWIYDNASRGIQLYPAAQRTLVRGNIVDGNGQGVIIGGDSGDCSNGNRITRNVLANSRLGWNAYSGGQGSHCRRNVVRRNCVFRKRGHYARNGGIQKPSQDFKQSRNRVAKPRYRNRRSGDLRLRPGTRCARMLHGR